MYFVLGWNVFVLEFSVFCSFDIVIMMRIMDNFFFFLSFEVVFIKIEMGRMW